MTSSHHILGIRPKICFLCRNHIEDKKYQNKFGETAYMICENLRHVCHKKCLKTYYKDDYDEMLDAGYIYASGKNIYKEHQCSCGKSMKIKNTLGYQMKKVAKWTLAPIVILLIAL